VRAERLAMVRVALGLALLAEMAIEYLPNLMDFYGPAGVAPAGLHDADQIWQWNWPMLVFNTDDPTVVWALFAVWALTAACWTAGAFTRLTNVALWFLTFCFQARNPGVLHSCDAVLLNALFLLMLMPTGRALSVDAWLRRRAGRPVPPWAPAWAVRVLQLQLVLIYVGSGLSKLQGSWGWDGAWPILDSEWRQNQTWWNGTSIHYTLNNVPLNRYSFAYLPLPPWLTMLMTWTCVWWEALFPLLLLHRWTRRAALAFGVMFHLGIYFTLEIGWFGFYSLALYFTWVPDRFWQRFWAWRARRRAPAAASEPAPAVPPEPAPVP
jgi:hypothetical protein